MLVFLDRPVAFRPRPALYKQLVGTGVVVRGFTYLSADEAIRLAISEYLHVDCRLTQAKQWGRVRSHCGHGQQVELRGCWV